MLLQVLVTYLLAIQHPIVGESQALHVVVPVGGVDMGASGRAARIARLQARSLTIRIVSDRGAPVPRLFVRLGDSNYAVATDDSGRAHFTNVRLGSYAVRVTFPELAPLELYSASLGTVVVPRDTVADVQLRAIQLSKVISDRCDLHVDRSPRSPMLFIRVLRSDGTAAKGAHVTVGSRAYEADGSGYVAVCVGLDGASREHLRVSVWERLRAHGKPAATREVDRLRPLSAVQLKLPTHQ
jgi:hypothetical protein